MKCVANDAYLRSDKKKKYELHKKWRGRERACLTIMCAVSHASLSNEKSQKQRRKDAMPFLFEVQVTCEKWRHRERAGRKRTTLASAPILRTIFTYIWEERKNLKHYFLFCVHFEHAYKPQHVFMNKRRWIAAGKIWEFCGPVVCTRVWLFRRCFRSSSLFPAYHVHATVSVLQRNTIFFLPSDACFIIVFCSAE